MAERIGGHWLDAGDGLVSVDPPPEDTQDAPGDAEWRAHVQHRQTCTQCRTSVVRCAAGDALWESYRSARESG